MMSLIPPGIWIDLDLPEIDSSLEEFMNELLERKISRESGYGTKMPECSCESRHLFNFGHEERCAFAATPTKSARRVGNE